MRENRVATVFDLVEILKNPDEVLTAMGLESDKVYGRTHPRHCKVCGLEGFNDLTLLGVHKKPLFFECNHCGALYLKRNKNWTLAQFKKIEGLYTNINDWYEPPHSEFN